MSVLENLIIVSEKAANIARKCRSDTNLFKLLVEEKKPEESNTRFVQDFKTLADVLIQETVKFEIGLKFPDLYDNIYGEESNVFSNTLGKTVRIQIQSNENGTSLLLENVLNGNKAASDLLAAEVHKKIRLDEVPTSYEFPETSSLEISNLAIWIDPIDSTGEYINACERYGNNNIYLSGLRCVTVLIGVYDKTTGNPIIGIINQPFHSLCGNEWKGKCFWGINTPNISANSISNAHKTTNLVCLSSSEEFQLKSKLQACGYEVVEVAGAGYKILTVILGLVDVYILTKSTTFKWDTCGPHALLRSLRGDIVVFEEMMRKKYVNVTYASIESKSENKIQTCCNVGGIVAFRNVEDYEKIMKILVE